MAFLPYRIIYFLEQWKQPERKSHKPYYPPTCIWDAQAPLLFLGKPPPPLSTRPLPFLPTQVTTLQSLSPFPPTSSPVPSTLDFSSISTETRCPFLLKKIPSSPPYPSATTPFSSFLSGRYFERVKSSISQFLFTHELSLSRFNQMALVKFIRDHPLIKPLQKHLAQSLPLFPLHLLPKTSLSPPSSPSCGSTPEFSP